MLVCGPDESVGWHSAITHLLSRQVPDQYCIFSLHETSIHHTYTSINATSTSCLTSELVNFLLHYTIISFLISNLTVNFALC